MLENWNFFTPSPGSSISRLPGLIASDSAADLAILSPNALPLSDLIDEAFIQDDSSPSRPPRVATTPPKIHSFIDSPAPRAGQFTTNPFRRPAARGQGGFLLGSPQPLPPSPLSGPIPFRQPSWSANTGARRASVPNASVRVAGPFASPLYGNHSSVSRGSLPSQSPRDPPSFAPDTQTNQGELFSPVYTLASPSWAPATQYTFPPRTPENTLDLHFDEVFAAGPSQEHTHQPTHRSISDDPNSSQVAAQYLRNRSLNPEFVKRYEVHDELGSGGFGFVCSAVQTGHGNILGKEVAVKFIFKDRIAECDQGLIHGEPVESYVLSRCNHPNIIAFRSLFEDPDFYYLVSRILHVGADRTGTRATWRPLGTRPHTRAQEPRLRYSVCPRDSGSCLGSIIRTRISPQRVSSVGLEWMEPEPRGEAAKHGKTSESRPV